MKQEQTKQTDGPAGFFPAGMLFPCLWANMWSKFESQKQTAK